MASVRIGFTGHQGLSADTRASVRAALQTLLRRWPLAVGVCSLAEGSDQIFAEVVLDAGGTLVVVVPSQDYEQTFEDESVLANYQSLLARAARVVMLDSPIPSQDAFWVAGRRVVDDAQRLVAVWDGKPAGGLGGTADVVRYANELGMEVDVVWPEGSLRA